jgi:hypothetical protein
MKVQKSVAGCIISVIQIIFDLFNIVCKDEERENYLQ